MKRITIAAAVLLVSGMFASCEKCATCSFNDPDLGTITDEFCDKGHRYDSTLEAYEANDWTCTED
jgi:hypothetical protein